MRPVLPSGLSSNGEVSWLTVVGARQNNLRDLDVAIPLGRFVCVTGVSGSGKSSLVNDIIRETLSRDLNGAEKVQPGLHDRIEGIEHLDKVIDINQTPIGRTPRSNPSTYIKVFDEIRALYAKLPDAKVRGFKPGRFSFNVHTGRAGGGRCEACEGHGSNKMEMDFLADVWVTCPVCQGKRFNRETLQIRFRGKNIADVLDMDVQEGHTHFAAIPRIAHMLGTLHEVGLDYIKLGQPSPTLSGGEAQRIKLARELVKKSTGRTLYLLDEPTTGLHFADIKKLLAVLHRFVDDGNTVVVIEHNLDVIKTADWVIDLGPEGGAGGGKLVAFGTPEQVSKSKKSFTGLALCEVLAKPSRNRKRTRSKPSRDRKRATGKSRNVITVVGAKQHNLKDITVEVPRNQITVCAGPSGSGKSSFAIDTVYTEGQRRYVESLSAYARQFLSRLQPPRVDHVDGLSPSICIERKTTSRSPRSTVGTITEIYDYMRILWTRIGQAFCPVCKIPIGTQSSDEIVEKLMGLGDGMKVMLLAPIERGQQESWAKLFERERANGYVRVRVDGQVYTLDEPVPVDHRRRHQVELVVDRIVLSKRSTGRIADSVEQALTLGNGVMIAALVGGNPSAGEERTEPVGSRGPKPVARGATRNEYRFSQHHACDECGRSYENLTPHHFSFNTRMGWCDSCEGLGVQLGASASTIVIHPTRSLANGAIGAWGELTEGMLLHAMVSALGRKIGFDLDTPWNDLDDSHRLAVLHGCGNAWIAVEAETKQSGRSRGPKSARPCEGAGLRFKWRGFFPAIHRATRSSWQYRKRLEDIVTEVACDACSGGRLKPQSAAVRVGGATIHEVCLWPLAKTLDWFQKIKLPPRERKIAGELLHEVASRLAFLVDVGLDYVSLHRTGSTLSGGEAQRIQLASQIGTGLTGVLYVLDEPTIGLHPRDNSRLIGALRRLRDLGNTLMVVEHDREVIDAADHVLDFGPGAGAFGGEVTAIGTPKRIRSLKASLTGQYLSNKQAIPVPANRRAVNEDVTRLTVHGARENNLREIDVSFPLGRFTCVTGVSGSGKSTLVSSILYNALAARIHRARLVPGGHERITGLEHIDKVINVDQSAIGQSPTSNPATYTGVFDAVRELFAKLPQSKIRGYTVNRFSFNRAGGRCEACEGMGQRCIEMHFLPDVWVECEHCLGKRYERETLEVQFRGKSIADVLNLRVSQALELFANVPKIQNMLQTLDDVGLGYVQLGQSAPTLSAGESQRVKLAAELGKPSTGKTLYILDEPTTGLHFDDLKKLLSVLHRLVDLGNTCICIEHNLDVIKTADWVIDLGPDAGQNGGTIVVEGTPESVVAEKNSYTGRALKPVLENGPIEQRKVYSLAEKVHLPKRPTTIDLSGDVKMPWEKDGRTWHTVNHLDHKGRPIGWDPSLLIWLVETMQALGSFSPTEWEHRSRIEITASTGKQWFCHLLTGGNLLVDVIFRVPTGTFELAKLIAKLKIRTLDERTDLPVYGQWTRIRHRSLSQGWEEWRLHLRDFKDIAKTTFRSFLKTATRAYLDKLAEEKMEPLASKPWLTDGEAWHISQKSINKPASIRWNSTLLLALIGRFKSIQPGLDVSWSHQTAVQLFVPGEPKFAAKIVTNQGRGLRVELRAPRAVVTPTMIEGLGLDSEIKSHETIDRLVFWVRVLGDINAKHLAEVWRRCRAESSEGRLQTA